MMAYLKPAAIETKIFNRLAMMSTLWDVHTLEVARRDANSPQRVPVVSVEHAAEVAEDERTDILKAYRRKAWREVNHYWRKLPHDSQHPTFRLTPG